MVYVFVCLHMVSIHPVPNGTKLALLGTLTNYDITKDILTLYVMCALNDLEHLSCLSYAIWLMLTINHKNKNTKTEMQCFSVAKKNDTDGWTYADVLGERDHPLRSLNSG